MLSPLDVLQCDFFVRRKPSLLVWSNIRLNSSKNLYCDAIGWMMPFSFLYCFVTLRSNIRGSIKTQRITVDYFCHQFCRKNFAIHFYRQTPDRPKRDPKLLSLYKYKIRSTFIYSLWKTYKSVYARQKISFWKIMAWTQTSLTKCKKIYQKTATNKKYLYDLVHLQKCNKIHNPKN